MWGGRGECGVGGGEWGMGSLALSFVICNFSIIAKQR